MREVQTHSLKMFWLTLTIALGIIQGKSPVFTLRFPKLKFESRLARRKSLCTGDMINRAMLQIEKGP